MKAINEATQAQIAQLQSDIVPVVRDEIDRTQQLGTVSAQAETDLRWQKNRTCS